MTFNFFCYWIKEFNYITKDLLCLTPILLYLFLGGAVLHVTGYKMFSFHKPKIYRSLHGCCICRAKSSSSRFTDSKRYEEDFEKCFRINHQRSGEICNACVLLVKRWKKLPPGSNRNWHHVSTVSVYCSLSTLQIKVV